MTYTEKRQPFEFSAQTKQQAIDLVTVVCINFRGTLQEHQTLQEALRVISGLVEPVKEQTKK